MDQHPVPRNISGFQFHLIGDMTLRQFVYLAGGVGLAFMLYKIAPLPGVVKIVLAAGCGLAGFAFAFIPVQERPLDKWLIVFFKSINSPTQYLWQKASIAPDILLRQSAVNIKPVSQAHIVAHRDAREKLTAYLSTLPDQPHLTLNIREKNYIDKTLSLFDNVPDTFHIENQKVIPAANPVNAQTILTAPQPELILSTVTTDRITDTTIPTAVKSAMPNQSVPQQTTASISPKSDEIKNELDLLTREKEALMKELTMLKGQVAVENKPQIIKPGPAKVDKPTITTVMPHAAGPEIGFPNFPQAANIVIGVIKDTQKRILPNIIITIKDRAGTPLRALKTGRLGQFSTASPLANDTYFLEVEDPMKRYVFDIAEIVLTGSVFPPIEITARGEKEIMREKLTKELFGSSLM